MRNFTLYLSLFLFPVFLSAQDTLTVQTFTWDSDTRSGNFIFPDASEGPFEKVLMRYNMRCHDAQVGSGSVGCREWDYSCNTFVTVPEMTDSILQSHPSHIISDFDGDLFEYSNTPVYTYIQFDQFETTYTNTITENTAQVGSGEGLANLTNNAPVAKTQWLFTVDELTSAGLTAGNISGLRLEINNANQPLNFLRIKLKHTVQTALSAESPELDGFTEVYFQNTDLTNGSWHPFHFHSPFEWDGSSNLLVEMSYFHSEALGNISATATGTTNTSVLTGAGPYYSLEFNGAGNIDINTAALSAISNEM